MQLTSYFGRSRRVYCNWAGNKIATLGPRTRVVPFLPRAPHARTAGTATFHTRSGILFSIVDRSKHSIRFAGVGELISCIQPFAPDPMMSSIGSQELLQPKPKTVPPLLPQLPCFRSPSWYKPFIDLGREYGFQASLRQRACTA